MPDLKPAKSELRVPSAYYEIDNKVVGSLFLFLGPPLGDEVVVLDDNFRCVVDLLIL